MNNPPLTLKHHWRCCINLIIVSNSCRYSRLQFNILDYSTKSVDFQSWRLVGNASWRLFPSTHKKLTFSLLGEQGLERYFRPDACMLGIPKPFESHFVWASRFCKTLLIPDVSLIKTRKAIAVDRIFFRFPALASSFILCVSGLSSPTGFISSQR